VQGVIQVQPANAEWLYRAGHAGEWIDPIAHAHVNLVTGLTMLAAGVLFQLAPLLGGEAPSRRAADSCFYLLLVGSLAFYAATLYLGFHEGRLVHGGLTPDQAEEATAVHSVLLMEAGIAMLLGFWLLLVLVIRSFRTAPSPVRWFAFAGCAALAVGTLQGPVQAFPAVNGLLERGGDAGEVIVNLHAQLNMLGGLLVLLTGLALGLLGALGGRRSARRELFALVGVSAGVAAYYAAGLALSGVEAYDVAGGASFREAVVRLEPWSALALCSAAAAVLVGFGAYASSTWTMTVRQRTAARQSLKSAPGLYAGRIPVRVRRRRPIALAGYEMPMALLGFPGVGWLFAGFPLTASVLLLAGPSLAWAVIPIAFSPYGDGPLRSVGWKFELAWLPASALVSAALLYRAHRRRRLRLAGPPPPAPSSGRNGYRTRVSVALGVIAVVLVSLPFLPAVTEIGGGKLQYAYQTGFTPEVTGQFLATPGGAVKLFAWRDPQESFPADSLRVHPADIRSLLVRASVVDRPGAYRLFDVTRGHRVPLAVRNSSPRALSLAPARKLAPGRYLFVATHQGMFGGRDFAYLSVVPSGSPITAIASHPDSSAPQIADALLPVAATLVAALFCVLLLRSFRRRPAGQKALWAAGFALFAVAAASEALAQRAGWNAGLFRAYYLTGGVLTVAYLGAGSAWLLLPRRARDLLLGGLVVATAAAVAAVLLAPVDAGVLAETTSGRPPANDALGGHAFLWAIALNSLGTLFLVGGSIYSILRRQRISANLWIGGGALVVALATGLSRTGHYEFVYLGQLVGIALMFAGFTFVGRAPQPSVARRSETAVRKTALAR
jgi:cytochrome c oxidase cbb3-type subunit 1